MNRPTGRSEEGMDICDELEAKWNTVHGGAFCAMRNAKREIERLRAEVARLKEHAVVLANTERHVERERCAAAAREVAEGYRSTEWGKAAECIGDACIAAIRMA